MTICQPHQLEFLHAAVAEWITNHSEMERTGVMASMLEIKANIEREHAWEQRFQADESIRRVAMDRPDTKHPSCRGDYPL